MAATWSAIVAVFVALLLVDLAASPLLRRTGLVRLAGLVALTAFLALLAGLRATAGLLVRANLVLARLLVAGIVLLVLLLLLTFVRIVAFVRHTQNLLVSGAVDFYGKDFMKIFLIDAAPDIVPVKRGRSRWSCIMDPQSGERGVVLCTAGCENFPRSGCDQYIIGQRQAREAEDS